VRSKLQ